MDSSTPEQPKCFCGIDNGVSGGLAIIDQDLNVLHLDIVPTLDTGAGKEIDCIVVDLILSKYNPHIIVLESGQKQPIFGCKGNFANGFNYGTMVGLLGVTMRRHIRINPKEWQKEIFSSIKRGKKTTKDVSLMVCRRMFPKLKLDGDHDKSDALCLALYARNRYGKA